jgi:hypothetical protein
MARLSLEDLRSRLALDYRAMRSLRGSTIGRIEAFVSPTDLAAGREAAEAQGLAGLATVYRVEFRFPMRWTRFLPLFSTRVIFQISPHDYPFGEPSAAFERGAIPFAPHVSAESGVVCTGAAWGDANGNWLLANLVVHVMRLANYDEPCTRHGLNSAAVAFANGSLGGRPLHPDLDYPVLDERVTHSGAVPTPAAVTSLFRRSSGFAPRPVPGVFATPVFARRAP